MKHKLEFKSIIMDLDGVLFKGERAIPGSSESIQRLLNNGVEIAFVTNNVSDPKEYTLNRISSLIPKADIHLIDPVDVLVTSLLVSNPDWGRSIFVVGTRALVDRMKKLGINAEASLSPGKKQTMVFVGSTMDFDYKLLSVVTREIQKGAIFAATGRERAFYWHGQLWPGTGALVAAIEAASGRQAVVLGKPSPGIFNEALKLFHQKSRPVVVGDDVLTDVQGAKNAGLRSVLLLSGVTTKQEAKQATPKPDYVAESLHELVSWIV